MVDKSRDASYPERRPTMLKIMIAVAILLILEGLGLTYFRGVFDTMKRFKDVTGEPISHQLVDWLGFGHLH